MLIATALMCSWLALAAFPNGAAACAELECSSAQTTPALTHPAIVHETIVSHNNTNLAIPIALASAALVVALAVTGYPIVLATRTSRRVARRVA